MYRHLPTQVVKTRRVGSRIEGVVWALDEGMDGIIDHLEISPVHIDELGLDAFDAVLTIYPSLRRGGK